MGLERRTHKGIPGTKEDTGQPPQYWLSQMPLTPSFSTRMLQISPLGQNSVRFNMERSAPLHTPASPSTAPGRHTVPPERSSWQWWYSPITSVITYWAAPLFCGQIMQVLSGWCDWSHWVDSCHDGYKPWVSTTSGLNTAVDGNMWMLMPCHAWMKAAIVTVAVPAKRWGHFLAMVAVFVPRCRKAGSDSTRKWMTSFHSFALCSPWGATIAMHSMGLEEPAKIQAVQERTTVGMLQCNLSSRTVTRESSVVPARVLLWYILHK